MNVRNYSFALIIGSFVSTMALTQAPAATAQQPVKKSAVQTKTETQHKDAMNGATTTATTAEKSAESKSMGTTHDGKHVAKASKTEVSKSVVTKKEEPAKAVEKSQEVKSSTTQSSQNATQNSTK